MSSKATEICENGIIINIENTVATPKKNEVFYNPEMVINRSIALTALASYIETGWCLNKKVRCLDAFGATGVAGLSWSKIFSDIEVTINDPLEAACSTIKRNLQSNNLNVEVSQQDVSILLIQKPFDFIYLDCYGSSVSYLDALFKNAPKNSVLVVTSTDDAALFGIAPDVTLRNYGAYVTKNFYAKELASRLIISSFVRAAAKCNKGVEVLSCIAVKSHITVIVKVTRGPAAATQCVHKIQKVIHCCLCEDRSFYSSSVHPIENPYSFLACECRHRSHGKVAVELGPVWIDPIFDPSFCCLMYNNSKKLNQTSRLTTLLQTILTESLGGGRASDYNLAGAEQKDSPDDDDQSSSGESSLKKSKVDLLSLCSPFYFNLHRHSPKGYDLGKLNKIVSFVQSHGYRASRTHFDPEAIRTSASLKVFNELLIQFSQGASSPMQ